ncbi:MAG: hypothetical protein WC867_07140 [Candidatus Pacearchaeota archaeon]|jgi:hypothetical protein
MNNKFIIIIIFSLISLFFLESIIAISPSGGEIIGIKNETAPSGSPTSAQAVAGNVTELNIFGFSTTQTWQGYFGNISGTIQLADGSGRAMYNWSATNPEGEVFASLNDSLIWTNLACFNFSSDGSFTDDSLQSGNTSLYGMNLTQLESDFGIEPNDVDGVNETFIFQDHPLFYVNNLMFSQGECRNTRIYNSTGQGAFDEVLLYSPDNRAVVFASILRDNAIGFDGREYDFEMLVLEDGHGEDVSTSTYYFYLELE